MSSLYDSVFQKQCQILSDQLKASNNLEEAIDCYYHYLTFLTEKRGHLLALNGFEEFQKVVMENRKLLAGIDVANDLEFLKFRMELMMLYEQFLDVKNERKGKKRKNFHMVFNQFLFLVQNNLAFLTNLSPNEYILIHNFLLLSKEFFIEEKIHKIEMSHSYSLLRLKYNNNSK